MADKTNPLLKGQYVRVFSDPITEQKLVGIAEVLKYGGATTHVTDSGDILHWCDLRFHGQLKDEMDDSHLVATRNIIDPEYIQSIGRVNRKPLAEQGEANNTLKLFEALRRAEKLIEDLFIEVRHERGGKGKVECSDFGKESMDMISAALDNGVSHYVTETKGK